MFECSWSILVPAVTVFEFIALTFLHLDHRMSSALTRSLDSFGPSNAWVINMSDLSGNLNMITIKIKALNLYLKFLQVLKYTQETDVKT